jgi:hypothetical protein
MTCFLPWCGNENSYSHCLILLRNITRHPQNDLFILYHKDLKMSRVSWKSESFIGAILDMADSTRIDRLDSKGCVGQKMAVLSISIILYHNIVLRFFVLI